ncbi:ECF transporter S component [Erysipelothrix sp. HDW6C]|uniref:ECF transporter S component n=1 Tax=Erysipelothrix sp. HDW6C TaxID=2714930 RepID=UPI001407224B|nr:ECF transporter S component [Erysipelothrix sp. HDW6C]QIK70444.1 ECF transporter S component [Erysipelothrix sp. HDW6C]
MNNKYEVKRTQTLVLIGIVTALITGLTLFTRFPIAYGYLNLGDVGVMLGALLLPMRGAIFAASVGSALADILGGYPQYAIFTIFIKASEVLVIIMLKRYLTHKRRYIAFFAAGLTMVVLYAGLDALLLEDANIFWVSAVGNLPQGLISALIVSLFYPKFKELVDRLRSLDS